MSNKAAWITSAKARPLKVDSAELPKAGENEVVIKNHAIAINPVDWKIQDTGMFVKNYPMVLGTDVAGEVHEVGEGVTKFKKGDRVIGHCFSLLSNDAKDGGFQLYTSCNTLAVSKIPTSLSYTQAAVLPLSISTASATLFDKKTLGITPPTTTSSPPAENKGKSVLVWGGSTSVGASAIQLAVAAGLKVVSVAGKHNIEKVKALGASEVFDHSDADVAQKVIKVLEGTQYVGVSDCVGEPSSFKAWAPVYEKLGGRFGTVLPEPKGLPEGIEGQAVFAPMVALADRYIAEAVWAQYVPEALENGALKAKPDPTVIEGGLEKVQEACDKLKEGISFGKIVVALKESVIE